MVVGEATIGVDAVAHPQGVAKPRVEPRQVLCPERVQLALVRPTVVLAHDRLTGREHSPASIRWYWCTAT